jgi:hypothetical protein
MITQYTADELIMSSSLRSAPKVLIGKTSDVYTNLAVVPLAELQQFLPPLLYASFAKHMKALGHSVVIARLDAINRRLKIIETRRKSDKNSKLSYSNIRLTFSFLIQHKHIEFSHKLEYAPQYHKDGVYALLDLDT